MRARPEPLSAAHERRRDLRQAMAGLEQAVSAPAAAVGWTESVGRGLASVKTALEAHIDEVDGPDGLLADVVTRAPGLKPVCDELSVEHALLRGAMGRAEQDLIGAMSGPEGRTRLRRRVVSLLGRLALHRQAGADLVYDAYNIDIAASD
jgi:hypothetical protein